MFPGTKQYEMLESFAAEYDLPTDFKNYTVRIGGRLALYRSANPMPTKNRTLNVTFQRWEWKAPIPDKKCDFVILHGRPSLKGNVSEKIFVIPKNDLEGQINSYAGQKKKISLDASVGPSPNRRTKFYFMFVKGPADFRAWLKKNTRNKKNT